MSGAKRYVFALGPLAAATLWGGMVFIGIWRVAWAGRNRRVVSRASAPDTGWDRK